MNSDLVAQPEIQAFLDKIAGLDGEGGDARLKGIVRRIVGDLFATIDAFDVGEAEFWKAVNFIASAAPELGLWAAGLGFEHFLDVRMDVADKTSGDGAETGETLIMHGRVLDETGAPVAGAVVDVWHANTLGNYSYFDPSQSDFNLRRQIETGPDGRYKFRSLLPSGYAVPPNGTTEQLLRGVGRHGNRPAHIHFFVSAPGHRHLTTQINIDGDPFLHNDFAYATRDELIPPVARRDEPEAIHAEGLNAPFTEIGFDFTLLPASDTATAGRSQRKREVGPAPGA